MRHVAAIKANARCAFAGLVDPDPQRGADYADMSEITEGVDGVIIATPTHLHASGGVYAAQRGWHVLIEKPVAQTLDDAQALAAAVNANGVGSLVGHHRRYHARIAALKEMISGGEIGRVVTASLIWAMRKPDDYFEGNWRTAGGSPVMINLVHDVDILRHVIGEIAQVSALRGTDLRGSGRIESGAVAMVFENGATGTISFADTTPSPWGFEAGTGENPNIGTTGQDMLWITGTKGAVSFPSMTLWRGTDWGRPATAQQFDVPTDTQPPLAAQLDHFIDVMDGATPRIDVVDGKRTLAVALDIETQLAAASPHTDRKRKAYEQT